MKATFFCLSRNLLFFKAFAACIFTLAPQSSRADKSYLHTVCQYSFIVSLSPQDYASFGSQVSRQDWLQMKQSYSWCINRQEIVIIMYFQSTILNRLQLLTTYLWSQRVGSELIGQLNVDLTVCYTCSLLLALQSEDSKLKVEIKRF